MKEVIPEISMPSNFKDVVYSPKELKFWVSMLTVKAIDDQLLVSADSKITGVTRRLSLSQRHQFATSSMENTANDSVTNEDGGKEIPPFFLGQVVCTSKYEGTYANGCISKVKNC